MSEETKRDGRPLWHYIALLGTVVGGLAVMGLVAVFVVIPLAPTLFLGAATFEKMGLKACIEAPVLYGHEEPEACLDDLSSWDWRVLHWGDEPHRERAGGIEVRTRMEVEAAVSAYRIAGRGEADGDGMMAARERVRDMMEELEGDEEKYRWVSQRWLKVAGPEGDMRWLVEGDEEEREAAVKSILRREAPLGWGVLAEVPRSAEDIQVPVVAALCLAGEVERARERIDVMRGQHAVEELEVACGMADEVGDHVDRRTQSMAMAMDILNPVGPLMNAVADEGFEVDDDHAQAVVLYGLMGLDEEGQELKALMEELGDRRRDFLRTPGGCALPSRDYLDDEAWHDPEEMEALATRLGDWMEGLEADDEELEEQWVKDLDRYRQDLWLEAARQWVWRAEGDRARAALDRRDSVGQEVDQWCEALVRANTGDVESAQAIQESYEGQESDYDWDALGLKVSLLQGEYDEAYERGLAWWESLRGTSVDALGEKLETVGLFLWAAMESGDYAAIVDRVGDAVESHPFAMASAEVMEDEQAMTWWRIGLEEEDMAEIDRSLALMAYMHQWVDEDADSDVWMDVVLDGARAERGVVDYHWLRIRAKEMVGRSDEAAERRATLQAVQEAAEGPERWWLVGQL